MSKSHRVNGLDNNSKVNRSQDNSDWSHNLGKNLNKKINDDFSSYAMPTLSSAIKGINPYGIEYNVNRRIKNGKRTTSILRKSLNQGNTPFGIDYKIKLPFYKPFKSFNPDASKSSFRDKLNNISANTNNRNTNQFQLPSFLKDLQMPSFGNSLGSNPVSGLLNNIFSTINNSLNSSLGNNSSNQHNPFITNPNIVGNLPVYNSYKPTYDNEELLAITSSRLRRGITPYATLPDTVKYLGLPETGSRNPYLPNTGWDGKPISDNNSNDASANYNPFITNPNSSSNFPVYNSIQPVYDNEELLAITSSRLRRGITPYATLPDTLKYLGLPETGPRNPYLPNTGWDGKPISDNNSPTNNGFLNLSIPNQNMNSDAPNQNENMPNFYYATEPVYGNPR